MNRRPEAAGAITLTRDELHKLAWETPMSKLAERFGLSGNGLAKICRRLDIPYPPRGYSGKAGRWSKGQGCHPAQGET